MNAEHPNVLLICTDHWPGLLTRPAGHREVMTPTLAQFARNGVHFSNAYATCPSCIPARRSLMTGLAARTHGDRIFDQRRPMPAVLWPLQAYMDLYRDIDIAPPVIGEWAYDEAALPYALRAYSDGGMALRDAPPHEVELARRAFYATLTHIDHQIRVVTGCLREEGLLDNTIIAFTSDHGDMLGDHGRCQDPLHHRSHQGRPTPGNRQHR